MQIKYSKKLEHSLDHIYNYIAVDNPKSATIHIEKILNSINLIIKNPQIGIVGRVIGTREFFIPSTNYFIVYKVSTMKLDFINIIHTSKQYY